jgi:transposase InsO family protein
MTMNGNNAILVFVDRLSKMVHFVPTTTYASAKDTVRLFVDNVFKLHGLPRDTVSNRGTVFTSNFWTEVCKLLKSKQSMSTAYHLESDKLIERVNQVLEDFLRHYVNPTHNDLDQYLSLGEFVVNNAWQEYAVYLELGQHSSTPK